MRSPGENKGYVRLNLQGRERDGSVDPAEADELLDDDRGGALPTFRDPDGSAVGGGRSSRMAKLAGGRPFSPRLPDLVVIWGDASDRRGLASVSSPRYGDVTPQWSRERPLGQPHRRRLGGGRPRRSSGFASSEATPRITDIGATACALFGADPTGLSGESRSSRPRQTR